MPVTFENRVTEKDVREWLDSRGHNGRSAKITGLDLHAIQRPGWVQVFRFCLRVNSLHKQIGDQSNESVEKVVWHERFGVVLNDERIRSQASRTQIWIFENEKEQKQKLDLLSEELITCRRGQTGDLIWCIGVFVCLLLFAGIVSSFFQ